MHILPRESHALDESDQAVDLQQTAADFVFLSFTDSDLAVMAAAAERRALTSLRLASLAQLKHPLSVDFYADAVLRHAKVIVIRILGGLDYWRYGAEQACLIAEETGATLVVIPGCDKADERLDRLSTVDVRESDAIWRCFLEGGADNAGLVLDWMAHFAGVGTKPKAASILPKAGATRYQPATATARAALVHYRALTASGDLAGITALQNALHAAGFATNTISLASTKEADCADFLRRELIGFMPDVIINTTSFSARQDDGSSPFDAAGCVVLQAIMSNRSRDAWERAAQGMGTTDLAMNVAMPEMDGRLVTRIIAFREDLARHTDFQCAFRRLAPANDRIAFVVNQALAFARLRQMPNSKKRLAFILNDYPGAAGRAGHAVGLDGPASLKAMAELLCANGYDLPPIADDLIRQIEDKPLLGHLPWVIWQEALAKMPEEYQRALFIPQSAFGTEGLAVHGIAIGKGIIALQPPRASGDRKASYHDLTSAPEAAYVAFYLWLQHVQRVDAIVHLGAHGTLEWLPGKSAGLSASCWPEILIGSVPVIYPFIVSDPGEAAQAKRRLTAITIGHLTPPMTNAGLHGDAAILETLLEEYASAVDLDPRRARLLEAEILDRAAAAGLMREIGEGKPDLQAIDGWLCDLKEMRVRDGLHVFGALTDAATDKLAANISEASTLALPDARAAIDQSVQSERQSLLAALGGRFVPPGPSGAPSRGRIDVLPTGRNMTTLDPRQCPTSTAETLGRRAAEVILVQHMQDHGEWPKSLVIDAWGSAAIRTGGEEIAQALALLGVRLKRDIGSDRINGFEIVPLAELGRSRIDIILRISGLYRDIFQHQISMFDAAIQAVAQCNEADEDNPLAAGARGLSGEALRMATLRVFGPAPQSYGTGLEAMVLSGKDAEWSKSHLAATGYAYGNKVEGQHAMRLLAERLTQSDGLLHAMDIDETDLLEAPDYAYGLGGYLSVSGQKPVYILDSRRVDRLTVRPLKQEIARTLRARAANPRWIEGQMRHGHRGGAEMAQTVDSLMAFAILGAPVENHQFELLHQAYLEDATVLAFLDQANPKAREAIEQRFAEAIRRGFWQPRRNSIAMHYADAVAA
jgi:cobaltochelatase CobN